jgi:hypothetical protein
MKILSTPHIPQTIVLHQSYNSKPSSILAMELSSNSWVFLQYNEC